MTTSIARRLAHLLFGSIALAPLLSLGGCAETAPPAHDTSVGFALTATTSAVVPALRVEDRRLLSHHANLEEEVLLAADRDGTVSLTFALRKSEGVTLTMNPATLEPLHAKPYRYPEHPRLSVPPVFADEPARVSLQNGGSVSCWTDHESGRVLAQLAGADGAPMGEVITVSAPSTIAYGSPHAVTADGRHVLVTFFTSDEGGFALAAVALEAQR